MSKDHSKPKGKDASDDNSDNEKNVLGTPKKYVLNRKNHPELNADNNIDGGNSAIKKCRLSQHGSFLVRTSANFGKNGIPSTPVAKNRHSTLSKRRFSVSDKKGNDIDITNKIVALNELKNQHTEIIDSLNLKFKFSDACLISSAATPKELSKYATYLMRYPQIYDENNFSKFNITIDMTKSKLSEINLCHHRYMGKYYVIKSGLKSETSVGSLSETSIELMNELKILSIIGNNKHIVQVFDSWIENYQFHIQLEYVRGGSLLDFITGNLGFKPTSDVAGEKECFTISSWSGYVLLAQICSALMHLHDKLKIFHGDIKPSNVLIDLTSYAEDDLSDCKLEGQNMLLDSKPNRNLLFKLCDFGRSNFSTDKNDKSLSDIEDGDGRYLPSLCDINVDNAHDAIVSRDIFALGLTIYQCFGGIINQFTSEHIRRGKWHDWPASISKNWEILLKKLAHKSQLHRYKAREILELEEVKQFLVPETWSNCQIASADKSCNVTMEIN